MTELQKAEARSRWANLVKEKLIPMGLLLPVAEGIHEWPPVFRDLIFDLAEFMREREPADFVRTAAQFRRRHGREILRSFSDEELALLLLKARDFELVGAE